MRLSYAMRRALLVTLYGLAAAALALQPARAQQTLRIAAVVNDDVISVLDVVQRTDLIVATSGLDDGEDTRRQVAQQVLRTLIDENLQLQEARRLGHDVDLIDPSVAYALVERQLGLAEGSLHAFLGNAGLDPETLDRKLRAELAWRDIVLRRTRGGLVTEDDVDEELRRIEAAAAEPAYLLAEIFLGIDAAENEAAVEADMARLREAILGGAGFAALARQFSQAASAQQGGDLGWIAESQLSVDLRRVLGELAPGALSQPIRTPQGVALVFLRDRRQGLEPDPLDRGVTLRQAILPAATEDFEGGRSGLVRDIAARLASCDDFDVVEAEWPELLVGVPVTLRLRELQPSLRGAVQSLAVNVLAPAFETDQGLHLVMVCERFEAPSLVPSRQEVRVSLANQQIERVARTYMRDLRRAAFVDIRL